MLEASPLPRLPVLGLKAAAKGEAFELELRYQSKEESDINGISNIVAVDSSTPRYPFVVMLDEVVR